MYCFPVVCRCHIDRNGRADIESVEHWEEGIKGLTSALNLSSNIRKREIQTLFSLNLLFPSFQIFVYIYLTRVRQTLVHVRGFFVSIRVEIDATRSMHIRPGTASKSKAYFQIRIGRVSRLIIILLKEIKLLKSLLFIWFQHFFIISLIIVSK